MVDDTRVTFVGRWFHRAAQADDEFDSFFAAWIALVVAAQRARDSLGQPRVEDDSDRQSVRDYFLARKPAILRAVEQHVAEMKELARRRGMIYRNPIVDTGGRKVRDRFGRLSRFYTHGEPMAHDDRVKAIAELLNKVRNNVFHGIKVYDDVDDLELLRLVNPVLLAVLVESEPAAVS